METLKDLVRQLKSAKSLRKSFRKVTARNHSMMIITEEEELPIEANIIAFEGVRKKRE